MQRLVMVGLNHTTAPLAVRERVAFSPAAQQRALEQFSLRFPCSEAVLLSTCNRVELYCARPVHSHPREVEMIEFIAGCHQLAPEQVASHFYRKSGREVVEHLFGVVASLDSMVLGETQIIGQVRSAYETSRAVSLAAAVLHPLFQRAIAVGREVMSQTTLGEGRLSVASVAVDYARRIFDRFADKTVLCIGAGKMTQLVLESLAQLGAGKLILTNRDPEKARALAEKFGGQAQPFEKLFELIVSADIVISSTASSAPIITRPLFEPLLRRRRYRPIFLIDIALPRDIEDTVGQLENVYLYNLDDLQQVVAQTRSQRQDALAVARLIVSRQVEEFSRWNLSRQLGPLIDRLYQHCHQLAKDEADKAAGKLGQTPQEQQAAAEELARRIVNKILHEPVATMRQGDGLDGPGGQYASVLARLFALHQQMGEDKPAPADDGKTTGR